MSEKFWNRISRLTSFLGRLFIILVVTFSLTAFRAEAASSELDNTYRMGVMDAAFSEKDEIISDLIPIVKENRELLWNADDSKVLVSTWKSQGSYEKFLKPYNQTSDNPSYAVWVTVVPQVQNLCAQMLAANPNISQEEVELRLKQFLGLDPDWQYDTFVEMWVDPADLFRPCVDPEVEDTTCNLNFGSEIPRVKNIADYPDFYENLYYKSYRSSSGVPWTGLGYTYDWGNPDREVGASEFILVPGASYEITRAVPTAEYCR